MQSFTKTTTKTYLTKWVKKGFTEFNEGYRLIRDRCEYRGFECFKCGTKFVDGDSIALVAFKNEGNKALCEGCADELLKSTPTERVAHPADWNRHRVEMLSRLQNHMRDPERTLVCDILANGQLLPDPHGKRYGFAATGNEHIRGNQ